MTMTFKRRCNDDSDDNDDDDNDDIHGQSNHVNDNDDNNGPWMLMTTMTVGHDNANNNLTVNNFLGMIDICLFLILPSKL